jgi:predicted dehydrogenase
VRAHTKQDILAVGSRSKDRAKEFASRMALKQAYGDYEEFVAADDLDVIYVATPHNLHHEGVTLALNAGKHVLVEKPIALNRVQALEMVELARRKRLFFAEALWTFYLPKFDVLRQLLEAKAIGQIMERQYPERFARPEVQFNLASSSTNSRKQEDFSLRLQKLEPSIRAIVDSQPEEITDPSG